MRYFIRFISILLCALHVPAQADDLLPANQSLIESGVLAGARGNMAINEAAGVGNQQVNAVAISRSAQGAAQIQVSLPQATAAISGAAIQENVLRIGAHAFAGASGITAINQVSGAANRQANSTVIALGPGAELATDRLLSGVVAGPTDLNRAVTSHGHHQTLSIDPTAFQNAHGIVQLNQAGGNANVSSNHFALRVTGGPTF